MMTPFFERDALRVGSDLAVGAANKTTDIVKVGLQPPPNTGGPFAGALMYYTFTQTGGSTDSDLTINTFPSYDGTQVDSTVLVQWVTSGATDAAAFHYTRMILACEPNIYASNAHYPPMGVAFRQTLSRADGDRALTVNVYARRFWWAMSR